MEALPLWLVTNDVPPIIIISSVLITICFIVQLLCCLKLRKWVLKLIPVYGFLLAGLLILLIYFGLYGKSIGNGGFLNTFDFLALVLACELGIAFIGNILAWVVWGMICGIRKLIRMRRK